MKRFDPNEPAIPADDQFDYDALFDALDAASRKERRTWQPKRHARPVCEQAAGEQLKAAAADGTFLDEDLRLLGKQGANLLEVVLLSLEDLERSRPGRRRRLGWRLSNFEKRVDCILANALRAHFYRLSDRVAYWRGADSYRHKPSWMSGDSMRKTVDQMVAADILCGSVGEWSGRPGNWGGACSTFWLSDDLAEFVSSYGVSAHHVGKSPPDPSRVIRMRGEKGADGKAPELDFELTPEIATSAELLQRYNCFSAKFDVSIDLTDKQQRAVSAWHERKRAKSDRQPGIKRLEIFESALTRVFNDGTFDHGGRLYGAFWTNIPAWLRGSITIDNEPTVELDYSGLSVRMIYHERGIDYRDDPYDIDELRSYALEQGLDGDHYRDSIKRLMQALINDQDDDGHPEAVKLDETFRPKFTRTDVKLMIEGKHAAIADAFRSGEGKRNQRKDSDLALTIITNLMNKGILALPIHDSFIVAKKHEEQLMEEMTISYQNKFGYYPIIK